MILSVVIKLAPSAVINHVGKEQQDPLSVANAAPFAVIPAQAGIHSSRRYESDEA